MPPSTVSTDETYLSTSSPGFMTLPWENATSDNYTSSFEEILVTTTPVNVYVKTFYEYDIFLSALWLFKNGWKFIAPPGLLGNLIVVIVTLKMKPFNSTSLFMISLAIVDFTAICVRIPFKEIFSLGTTEACKAMWYLYNVLPVFSNYILLFWTLERVIAVVFPLRVTEWCTVRRTAIVVAVAGILSFGINVSWPISIDAGPTGRCRIQDDMMEFIYDIWYKVDSSVFIFIPGIIILLSNLLIISRLQQSTKRHQQMTSSEDARRKREKEQRNTTITLLVVSFAFLILHTPLAVFNCFSLAGNTVTDQQEIARWQFVNAFGLTMMEMQNSVNFYLYFLTGRRYRRITFSILVPCRKASVPKSKGLDSSTAVTGVSTLANVN